MAEHTKLITIDPNGDTLLKLKGIRWELPEWIDEATRFAPPAETTEAPLENTATELADTSNQRKHPEEVHFLVSSRQLRLVSTYFDAMFKRDFAESVADSKDGKYHIWATEWNPTALEQLLIVAHARSTGLNDHVYFNETVEMALIIDYYDMREAPYTHFKKCFLRWGGNDSYSIARHRILGSDVVKRMFLSYVFQSNEVLGRAIEIAKKHSKGPLQDLGLPLGNIPGKTVHHPITSTKKKTEQACSLHQHENLQNR